MANHKLFFILFCLFAQSCANIQSIKGGPEDKEAPVVVASQSSPNYQLHYKGDQIVLSFNEWIRLDNPTLNISISPSTVYPADIKLKGKRIIIRFDEREILQEQTTYVIQFGESIKDITSGNVQRNVKYVFSTGDYLDSLSTQIQLIDGFSNRPKEKVLISLYKNLDDTAVQKTKPFYFAWTDSSGRVTIQNMSPGRYRLYALEDKNQNYKYDQSTEAFAFYPEIIEVNDKTDSIYTLYLSTASLPVIIKEKRIRQGKTIFQFSEKPHTVSLSCHDNSSVRFVQLKDSLLVWNLSQSPQSCILSYDSSRDTFETGTFLSTTHSSRISMDESVLKPGQLPGFTLSDPVLEIDKEKIIILDSAARVTAIRYDTADPRKFFLEGAFSLAHKTSLVIPQEAIQSFYPVSTPMDTFSFRYYEKASLSRLKLSLESLQSGENYILQLIQNQSINEELTFEATGPIKNLLFDFMIPGKYEIRMIHDKNKNGRWDSADFSKKRQAESVKYFELAELRADWDIEVNIKW
jgi:uncharacterized protein (DUF2141 family)